MIYESFANWLFRDWVGSGLGFRFLLGFLRERGSFLWGGGGIWWKENRSEIYEESRFFCGDYSSFEYSFVRN